MIKRVFALTQKAPTQRWPITYFFPLKIWFNWLFLSHYIRYVSTWPQLYGHFVFNCSLPTACCLHKIVVVWGDLNLISSHDMVCWSQKWGWVLGSGSNGCALGDVGKFLPPTTRDALGPFYRIWNDQEAIFQEYFSFPQVDDDFFCFFQISKHQFLDASQRESTLKWCTASGENKNVYASFIMDCLVLARSGFLGYASPTTLGLIRNPLMVRVLHFIDLICGDAGWMVGRF